MCRFCRRKYSFVILYFPILFFMSRHVLCQELALEIPQHFQRNEPASAGMPTWPCHIIHDLAERGISLQYSTVHDLSNDPLESMAEGDGLADIPSISSASMEASLSERWAGIHPFEAAHE
jgi:hypothetical protein